MNSNQSFDEKVTTKKHNEDYDLCSTEAGQKFIVQWSPQNGARYLSRNRYASPRSLSKLVPKRSRGIVRYNINRSLNFDIGTRSRADSFKSPNSSTDSNQSADNDNYLSRSAKILRALNIDYSPLKITGLGIRKINKSLNFDLSPSPKNLVNYNKCMINGSTQCLVSPLSKINKTLNFETSSGESSVNSRLDSSVDSIDENQNQTPSQRNRKAKKSLNYPSPKFESKNLASPNVSACSPMLRSDLRDKINSIIQRNMTPNLQSSKRNLMKNKFEDFGASTPRNLFNDFHDYEDEVAENRDNIRAQTPENFITIIPESMSAIKKSHRKERVLGRLGKAIAYQAKNCSSSKSLIDMAMDTALGENRLMAHNSPQCGVNSIKQSYKKDKSKRKSHLGDSEDGMSETGSIFDYSNEIVALTKDSLKFDKKAHSMNIRRGSHVSDEGNDPETSPPTDELSSHAEVAASSVKDGNRDIIGRPEAIRDADKLEIVQGVSTNIGNLSTTRTSDNDGVTMLDKSTVNSLRPVTPENCINFLQRVMTNSIKKSHKKIKDTNKKKNFKPRTIIVDAEQDKNLIFGVNEDNAITGDCDRAVTPENANSSRLLLSQFSSVKKSHRKDKHRRMVSGSLQRKKFFGCDGETATNSDSEVHNCSVASPTGDFPSPSLLHISSDRAEPLRASFGPSKKIDLKEFSSSDDSCDAHYHSLEGCSLSTETREAGINALSNFDFHKASPNKRKNVSNYSLESAISQSPTSQGSMIITYENAEEEFKIFTPIKKRKSLNLITPITRRICDVNEPSPETRELSAGAPFENSTTRCSTPTTARAGCSKLIENSFTTPDRGGGFVAIADYSTPLLRDTIEPGGDSSGGRATPQNRSADGLIVDVNSIKKSHKKDKRGNVSRRYSICPQEHESEFTSGHENDSSKSLQSQDSPKPSTSCASANEGACIGNANEEARTPPNCLQAKNYLRFLQTESIKRSHKKVRERKKYGPIVVDPEVSDDSSIFGENEQSLEIEDTTESENEKSKNSDQTYTLRDCSSQTYFASTSYENKDQHFQDTLLPCASGDVSNGSSTVFDPEEEPESPCKSGDDVGRANTSRISDES